MLQHDNERQRINEPLAQILDAGGEMGRLIREKDWSKTPLGAIETWPQSLKTTVSICLLSRFPIVLWWGPELVKIYNDAYRPILGATKRPAGTWAARTRNVGRNLAHHRADALQRLRNAGSHLVV
ncbi:MAG: hypothetical protein HC828_16985 [Blastochloris sp.]|nr:hypothetical protein [Blastochloris sp.]